MYANIVRSISVRKVRSMSTQGGTIRTLWIPTVATCAILRHIGGTCCLSMKERILLVMQTTKSSGVQNASFLRTMQVV